MTVTRNTTIEELVETIPAAIAYLREKGIRCILCGEPVWGTIEQAARDKGFTDGDIDEIVRDLNNLERVAK